jgi:serine/threonine protein kinase
MSIGSYRLLNVIGDGSFSTVRLAHHAFTNEPVAIKIISKDRLTSLGQRDSLLQRIAILRRLNHPGVVKLIDAIEDDSTHYLIFEYCNGGELFDFITSRSRVEEPLAKRLFKQIALAVGYIHSQNVIHRDLKPENLLLTQNISVKIIDFGLANAHADVPLQDRCGSPCYIAPEALGTSEYYGIPADIWALGVILYALVDGSLPWNYEDAPRMLEQITGASFQMPDSISPACQDLLRGILNPDPGQRFTIDAILMHPWLFGVGNVFPVAKPADPIAGEGLKLSFGGSSASNLRPQLKFTTPVTSLETIFEDQAMQGPFGPGGRGQAARLKPVQPRSISLSESAMTEEAEADGTNTHHGPIMSQTSSSRDPQVVAAKFESTMVAMGITYWKLTPLEFQLSAPEHVQLTAEVCRLTGFRNVYLISFKRLKGESWTYHQFVTRILAAFKAP